MEQFRSNSGAPEAEARTRLLRPGHWMDGGGASSGTTAEEGRRDCNLHIQHRLRPLRRAGRALFFAGVVSSFESRGPKIVLLTMSMVMLAAGAARIVELPVG